MKTILPNVIQELTHTHSIKQINKHTKQATKIANAENWLHHALNIK